MPVINTRGALSATGFGFLGNKPRYWINSTYPASYFSYSRGAAIGSDNSVYALDQINSAPFGSMGLLKIKPSGVIEWQVAFSPTNGSYLNPYARAICLDASDNIICNTHDYSSLRPVIVKYNSSGVLQWQYVFSVFCYVNSITTDSSGNIYAVAADSNGGVNGGLLIKLNSSGSLQWIRKLTTGHPTLSFTSVDVLSNGEIRVSGNNTSGAFAGVNVVRFNSSGSYINQTTSTNASGDVVTYSMSPKNTDNENYLVGFYNLSVGAASIVKVGISDTPSMFVAITPTNAGDSFVFYAAASDNLGYVYAVGMYNQASGSVTKGLIVKMSSAGVVQWANTISDTSISSNHYCNAVKVDGFGDLYVTYYSAASPMLFKVPRNGEQLGAYNIGGWPVTYSSFTAYTASQPGGTTASTSDPISTPAYTFVSGITTSGTGTLIPRLLYI